MKRQANQQEMPGTNQQGTVAECTEIDTDNFCGWDRADALIWTNTNQAHSFF